MKRYPHLEIMREFKENNLPDLDVAVLGAIELFENADLPTVPFDAMKKPIVLGSGNAEVTGRILFKDRDAVFADESDYKEKLNVADGIDCAVLMSASGSRDAVKIAQYLRAQNMPTYLLTNNSGAEASKFIDDDKIFVFPKNREPYTYNVSTYMGMILAKTGENPKQIAEYLLSLEGVDFSNYNAFYLLVPEEFSEISPMFRRKFDELLGSKIAHRVFTLGQTGHGHTVVEDSKELFIGLGVKNDVFGMDKNRLNLELPNFADFGTVMALGYYLIGKIQAQNPPYFKESIGGYTKRISKFFGKEPPIIVD